MKAIRQRLFVPHDKENGLTLVEVIVAMMIFMIISVSVLYTMVSLLSVTRDSRNRQVAANLAAQEIDLARDINDVFNITAVSRTFDLNGETFTVKRTANWVYSSGAVAPCGSGSGALRYKFVEVEVSWPGAAESAIVRTNTYINPNERINDPTLGTLIASVTTANGEPVAGASVTATPSAGPALTDTTDSEGCSFFLGVAPGSFTVKVASPSGSVYVDINGVQQPTLPATVVAGTAASVAFTYDPAGTFRVTYSAAGLLTPINLPTSLVSTRDPSVNTATAAANPRSFYVSPWTDGYSVIAGNVIACAANDPGQWTASPGKLAGVRPDPVETAPGETTDVTVPAGTLTVTGMPTSGTGTRYLIAVSNTASSVPGRPGCTTQQVLRFAQSTTSTMNIVLPYGSWNISKGTTNNFAAGTGTVVGAGSMTAGPGGSISGGVVTFDPREAG